MIRYYLDTISRRIWRTSFLHRVFTIKDRAKQGTRIPIINNGAVVFREGIRNVQIFANIVTFRGV